MRILIQQIHALYRAIMLSLHRLSFNVPQYFSDTIAMLPKPLLATFTRPNLVTS